MASTSQPPSDPGKRSPTAGPPKRGAVNPLRIKVESSRRRHADEPLAEWLKREVRSSGAGWLVSLGLHVLVLFVLALIVIHNERKEDLAPMIGGWITAQEKPKKPPREAIQIEAVKLAPAAPAASKAAEAPKTATEQNDAAQVVTRKPLEVNVGSGLSGRAPAAKEELLKDSGGTKQTEQAVAMGLNWLKNVQHDDGHWELYQPPNEKDKKTGKLDWRVHPGYPDGGTTKTDTGATALALLAFLGAGHTHHKGEFQKEVRKGLTWLKTIQLPNGDLHDGSRREEGLQTSFYAHGQATIVLCEAYGLTADSGLLDPAQKALTYIYNAQNPSNGGWKYRPQGEGDLSVTGWQLMALQSARMAKLVVPAEVLDRAAGFLDQVQVQNGARYKYDLNPSPPFSPAMTAEGLLCRQYLGWPREHPALRDGVAFLMQPENLPRWTAGRRNVYAWYYATQVLHNIQGKDWETWNAALREELVKNQVKGGKQGGSWHPTQPEGDHYEYAAAGGRLYVTAMCILMMEVYYRHLPLYRDSLAAAEAAP